MEGFRATGLSPGVHAEESEEEDERNKRGNQQVKKKEKREGTNKSQLATFGRDGRNEHMNKMGSMPVGGDRNEDYDSLLPKPTSM